MTQCKYNLAWIGQCKEEATENGMCLTHAEKKCTSCKAPATHECDSTGQFVCGAPLCNDCAHTIRSDGTNGNIGFYETCPLPEGMKEHCRKTEQVFQPWYMRKKS